MNNIINNGNKEEKKSNEEKCGVCLIIRCKYVKVTCLFEIFILVGDVYTWKRAHICMWLLNDFIAWVSNIYCIFNV